MCSVCLARQRDHQVDELWIVYLLFLRIISLVLGPWIGVQREICWFVWEDYTAGRLRDRSLWVTNKKNRRRVWICHFEYGIVQRNNELLNCARIMLPIEAPDLHTQDSWASWWEAFQLSRSPLRRMEKILEGMAGQQDAVLFYWQQSVNL